MELRSYQYAPPHPKQSSYSIVKNTNHHQTSIVKLVFLSGSTRSRIVPEQVTSKDSKVPARASTLLQPCRSTTKQVLDGTSTYHLLRTPIFLIIKTKVNLEVHPVTLISHSLLSKIEQPTIGSFRHPDPSQARIVGGGSQPPHFWGPT